ncbi:MAG TPA: LLM class flavin-dependent oxidoreductase [Flexivirga sp.]|uniref:LLM class flavin-dependent oxidoreductase n=1 Tax=Flexivirga sp. TaxID=1962927 RepID=UPI002BCD1C1B|nr:LLM class flavin-dependent oxidoreductase [Flexivirga sp.]HWC20797.1 LLM class flavin-dependent oxidoreductase [Flexivirga sp.]
MTKQLPDIDVIANPQPDLDVWRTLPRELEAAGFHGVVCPDNPWSADPFQLMAIAASVTTTLHVGTHVLAAPLREPTEVADQTRSLAALSGGRFCLGLGTGLPMIHEYAQRAGRPAMDGRAARSWIAASARAVRAAQLPGPVPITVAAGGPRALAAAAAVADEIALAIRPTATADDVSHMVQSANTVAQQHDREITFVVNPIAVGDRVVGFHDGGPSVAELRAAGAFALLPERAEEIAVTLASWRSAFGIARIVVSEEMRDELAGVLTLDR